MLAIDQLQVRADAFGGPALLEAVSLQIKRGEAVGLVGPSGCGKTTLLRSIAGLIDPLGGVVAFDGKTPGEWGWPAFRRRVCLVPQRPVVWDGSVSENLIRPRKFQMVEHRCQAEDVRRMLAEVGLAGKHDAQASELSEGEKQRVCLVRAFLAGPECLLLDEPTSALDGESVKQVETLLIQQMHGLDGVCVLLSTHDRAMAERICTRVIDLSAFMVRVKAVADA